MNRPRSLWLAVTLVTIGLVATTAQAQRWMHYAPAQLDTRQAYDGDSFHVITARKTYIFRIYFADAPEVDMKFPDRVSEQGKYWNLSDEEVIALGKTARVWTRDFMKNGVEIWTRKQDALGESKQPRYFAFVRADGKDLATELVRQGLARIHGMGSDFPDGDTEKAIWRQLHAAEKEARENHRGGWALKPSVTP